MLSERTNILLDKETRNLLSAIARNKKTSMGDLIRAAIDKVYKKSDDEIIQKRTKAMQEIVRLRNKMKSLKNIDYHNLIEYGRYR